ncbi:MAG: hypothetical protein A4E63_01597 [Syntrophorhabdus sp. PtaU1.Bin050]|jgi:hypothetical protein|nr:MAG: hypothetical protein A4E63_01597 [Syntrophorhabdus sp. PtaU1.Bin050]
MGKVEFEIALKQSGLTEDDLARSISIDFLEKYGHDVYSFYRAVGRIIETGNTNNLKTFLDTCIMLVRAAVVMHPREVEAAKGKVAMAFWSDKWGKA